MYELSAGSGDSRAQEKGGAGERKGARRGDNAARVRVLLTSIFFWRLSALDSSIWCIMSSISFRRATTVLNMLTEGCFSRCPWIFFVCSGVSRERGGGGRRGGGGG